MNHKLIGVGLGLALLAGGAQAQPPKPPKPSLVTPAPLPGDPPAKPLHLELSVPDAVARYSNSMTTTPAEKPAGSCVIVINLHSEDSEDE